MKNLLDMLEEFCRLNDERIVSDGRLSLDAERRWRALKALYESFMLPSPTRMRPSAPDSTFGHLKDGLLRRAGIRVPTDMHIFFRHEDEHLASRMLNLSRGGMFLSSKSILLAGSPITIYLPNVDCIYGELFETEGNVAWNTAELSGAPLHGMGISFSNMGHIAAVQLDAFIIEILNTRLSKAG